MAWYLFKYRNNFTFTFYNCMSTERGTTTCNDFDFHCCVYTHTHPKNSKDPPHQTFLSRTCIKGKKKKKKKKIMMMVMMMMK
jgi:hypothetical protein